MRPPRRSPRRPTPPSADAAPGVTSFLIENVTRVELWRFFEPYPEGGARARLPVRRQPRRRSGVHYDGPRWSLRGASSTCGSRACRAAPSARAARQRRRLLLPGRRHLQLPVLPAGTERGVPRRPSRRVSMEMGRLSFMPAPEPEPPLDPTESLARSGCRRGCWATWRDRSTSGPGTAGARAWSDGGWQWSATAAMPTQGTFEESANLPIDRLQRRDARRHRRARRPARSHAAAGVRDRVSRHPGRARPPRQQRVPATAADVSHRHGRRVGHRRLSARCGTWDLTAWSAGTVRRLVRAVASRAVGAGSKRLPLARGARAAAGAGGRDLRLRAMATRRTTATAPSSRCCPRAIATCGRTPTP